MPEAFGISSSTISRRFIEVSANKLRDLMERDLSGYDFVALFKDGKSFAQDEMIIALGVSMSEEKVIMGFIQAATEKEGVVKDFLHGLIERGLRILNRVYCASSMEPRGSDQRFKRCLGKERWCNGVYGTSGRMWWIIAPSIFMSLGEGSFSGL